MLFRIKRRLYWEWHKWTDKIYRQDSYPAFCNVVSGLCCLHP